MPTSVLMPELGESIVEGTIVRWLKREGERVQEDEPIVEIMTDKVNTELPAPASGVLQKILAPEGATIQVGQELAVIDGAVETAEPVSEVSVPAPAEVSEPPAEAAVGFYTDIEPLSVSVAPAQPAVEAPPTDGKRGVEQRYSPLVRRMAQEQGVSEAELAQIRGTGSGGRVTKLDLQRYLASRTVAPAAAVTHPPSVTLTPPYPQAPAPVVQPAAGELEEVIPFVGLRRVIADRLTQSYQTAVHVTTVVQVDVSKLVEFRERNKDSFQQQHGVRLTYMPFFVKAAADALMEFPMLNASLTEDEIIVHKYVHMGVAVALGAKGEGGLIVPVIRDANRKSLIEIAHEMEDLAQRARENRITPGDLQGATFTITNTGSYGALIGTPIISQPQSAILGTYAIVKMPVVINDMIAIRSMMHLCLSYDHRLIDGMYAGGFLQRVKLMLENFEFFR